jgi:cytochrome P450 family 142 subfamily A polypeptide 1
MRAIDLLDGDLYANGAYETYAWLRSNAPVYWDATNELWGISRYDDILEIEKRKDVFVSSDKVKGGYRPNIPADDSIIGLDDPLHSKRRALVSRRFTPRAVQAWEVEVRQKVTMLLDAVAANDGRAEIVGDLAAPLPAMMIGKLLGFGEEQWADLESWSERTIAMGGGPRYFTEAGMEAAMEFAQAAANQLESKRGCPLDDIFSLYTTASVEGTPMTEEAAISDGLLLLDGGAETTRTVIARTMVNLVAHPAQWDLLKDGADIAVAVEEFIRFVTPVHNMCRVATRDYELAGQLIPEGQQVVLMYGSANRDEDHFDRPEEFDVRREPNNHIAFGFGTHFCLGAALARLEIRTFFEELLRRVQSLQLAAGTTPVEMPNAFVYGLASAEMELTFE